MTLAAPETRNVMQARWWQVAVRPQRIRTYLVLFALAITIPLLGLAVFALNRMATVELAQIERWVVQTAQDMASDLDRELDRAFVTLETLATSSDLKRGDLRAFHAQALLALRGTKGAIVLIDRSYQQLVDTLKEYGAGCRRPPIRQPRSGSSTQSRGRFRTCSKDRLGPAGFQCGGPDPRCRRRRPACPDHVVPGRAYRRPAQEAATRSALDNRRNR